MSCNARYSEALYKIKIKYDARMYQDYIVYAIVLISSVFKLTKNLKI